MDLKSPLWPAGQCVRLPCEEASPELLHSIHRPEFVSAVDAMSARLVPPRDHLHAVMQAYEEPANTHAYFTPDTYVNRYSSGCARLAAGGCAAVAAAVARCVLSCFAHAASWILQQTAVCFFRPRSSLPSRQVLL